MNEVKMTDSLAVDVLERLEKALPDIGVNGWIDGVAAVQHAIARLREPAGVGGEWVLVPRKPTEAMLEAAHYELADRPFMNNAERSERVYAAMLAAQPPSAPVGVEGLMQLAREWCLSWGEWAHDADPGCAKENAAEAALRAALTQALAQQPAAVDGAQLSRIVSEWRSGVIGATSAMISIDGIVRPARRLRQ